MKKIKTFQKGFTLIELLVVIAVIGILAAGVLTAINPLQKMNQARDANIKNDVAQVAQAAQAYFTANAGVYPASKTVFTTDNELKTFPATVSYATNGSAAAAYAASKVDSTKYICWDSTISTIRSDAAAAPTDTSPICNN